MDKFCKSCGELKSGPGFNDCGSPNDHQQHENYQTISSNQQPRNRKFDSSHYDAPNN